MKTITASYYRVLSHTLVTREKERQDTAHTKKVIECSLRY